MKILFLLCALSLPPVIVHYRGKQDISARLFISEHRELMKVFNKAYPGEEFILQTNRIHSVPKGYASLPFMWRKYRIYRKIKENSA